MAPAVRAPEPSSRGRPPDRLGDRQARPRRARTLFFRALFPLLTGCFTPLGWRQTQAVGRAIGWLSWRLSRRERVRALEHLRLAFPELQNAEREALARACALHLGMNLAECLRLFTRRCGDVLRQVDVEGLEHVEAAREMQRPILFVTGHCGNWELLGPVLNCRGVGMVAIARRLLDPWLNDLILALRRRFGTETILRGAPGASRLLLRTLRGGGALTMLIDQDTRVDGVWVPFFGRLAYTPVGAAEFALRHHATVIPAFLERLPSGRHLARFLPPLTLGDDPVQTTAQMTALIEQQIRRCPEQWVWHHKRWRRRPPEEAGEPPPLKREDRY